MGREEGMQGRQGKERGMGRAEGKQKDMKKTPVSFAIVSDHLPSFSILSMDSYDMARGCERVRREANTSGHDTFPDGRGYHTPAGKGLFEPRWM